MYNFSSSVSVNHRRYYLAFDGEWISSLTLGAILGYMERWKDLGNSRDLNLFVPCPVQLLLQ